MTTSVQEHFDKRGDKLLGAEVNPFPGRYDNWLLRNILQVTEPVQKAAMVPVHAENLNPKLDQRPKLHRGNGVAQLAG